METYFTIIIPVKAINDYVRETVLHIQRLYNSEWELFIIPNAQEENEWEEDKRIAIISSGRVGPADKRDLGAKVAIGEVLVFLDDDSYPEYNFLDEAKQYFLDINIVALGGPAITPPQDGFWQKVSGAVFLSKLSGGVPERYIPLGNVRPINDWPSVNLMVRKKEFLSIGGFNSPYWPGEDTKLCLDLIKKTGKKILYIPQMQVWHHRRAGLLAHLKQVGAYGLHRGYFFKKYPETSRKVLYCIPSLFVVFVVLYIISNLLFPERHLIFLVGWSAYFFALSVAWNDIRRHESIGVSTVALVYTFFTHLYYGTKFLQGLFVSKLTSRLR